MRDPRHLVRPHHLAVATASQTVPCDPPRVHWTLPKLRDLTSAFFASPYGMAQHDDRRRELLREVLDVVVRVTGGSVATICRPMCYQ